jgi:cardiolipin synthase
MPEEAGLTGRGEKAPSTRRLLVSKLLDFNEWEKAKNETMNISATPELERPAAHRRYSEEGLWTSETILFSGREFADALISRIRRAMRSVRIESYIFERDEIGREVIHELKRAAARGVKVRVIVDAIGSPQWDRAFVEELAQAGVRAQIFGSPRALLFSFFRLFLRGHWVLAYRIARKVQLRNHRKLAIFDENEAIVGSANIGRRFDEWRETAVILRGPGVLRLRASFVRSWHFARGDRAVVEPWERTPRIRTNFLRRERRTTNRRYLSDVTTARQRIWITTAYFNPGPRLVHALLSARRRGVDVRIVVPFRSDVSFFPWFSRAIFAGLVGRGLKVYEFEETMQHAKSTLFDRRALVGSTNLNHRSYIHDLELDVVLESSEGVETLERLFLADCSRSIPLTPEAIRGYAPVAYAISFLLLPFKRWL